jgi:2-methylisocitrate lyase-like PEP mutase family enzyme
MAAATDLTVNDLAALGVRRISLGGGLARATCWTALRDVAREMLDGKFTRLAGTMTNAELNAFFRDDMQKRPPS